MRKLSSLSCIFMFRFKKISLTQFRNYSFKSFDFNERVIGICGPNGSGKTNLLDAIHYLCFTKSYFSGNGNLNMEGAMQGYRIEGTAMNDNKETKLICILRENNRKEFYTNGEAYKKFSEHIGRFPCVMVAPDDVALITDGSEERRKFIDTVLSQLYPQYLHQLIDYNKILLQRNGFLKAAAERNYTDEDLLNILDGQLAEKGQEVFEQRKKFLSQFLPVVKQQYASIAEKEDGIALRYFSQLLNLSLKELLQQNRPRDLFMQRTGCGIHKDDLEIFMHSLPFKTAASQGQRKSLLFALKLAEYMTLKDKKSFTPVLLLDDVFEKLDAQRMHNLLQKVCMEEQGQVFITDTHKERLDNALKSFKIDYQLISLAK